MDKETLQQVVHGIIHEGKQIPESEDVVMLTAKRIGRLTHNGTLDFGGSEYTEAPIEWIEPKKKSDDDRDALLSPCLGEGGTRRDLAADADHPRSAISAHRRRAGAPSRD